MLTECKAGLFLNAKYMLCESHERFWQVIHKFQKHSFCMLLSKEFLKQAKFLGMWWSSEHALLQAYLMLVKFLLLSSNVSSYRFREKMYTRTILCCGHILTLHFSIMPGYLPRGWKRMPQASLVAIQNRSVSGIPK